jgi:hypothetical protein
MDVVFNGARRWGAYAISWEEVGGGKLKTHLFHPFGVLTQLCRAVHAIMGGAGEGQIETKKEDFFGNHAPPCFVGVHHIRPSRHCINLGARWRHRGYHFIKFLIPSCAIFLPI